VSLGLRNNHYQKQKVYYQHIFLFHIFLQVENKPSRILIRPELFHLSQAILNIPGSHIEDRQYEINLNGLAVLTGRWSDIEEKSTKPAKPILKTMGENPGKNMIQDKSELNGESLPKLMKCVLMLFVVTHY
jgi:hypothetical protein